jgi:cytochrome c oxidase subunit III
MSAHALPEQFAAPGQQREAATLGMWVFLATELMFFAPLLFAYLYGRTHEGPGFAEASRHTHVWIGTANTAILLTSSLAMALAVRAAQLGQGRALALLLRITAALGLAFLALKGLEYRKEWQEGLVPVFHFAYGGPSPRGVELFYVLYFLMTGVHALHLTIGVCVVGWLSRRAARGAYGADDYNPVEVAGLYWHFVDSIWIFLYPMIYLLERYAT